MTPPSHQSPALRRPQPSHPQYDHYNDTIQCQVIRNYTMDAFPEIPPLRNRMDELVGRDINEILKQNGDIHN